MSHSAQIPDGSVQVPGEHLAALRDLLDLLGLVVPLLGKETPVYRRLPQHAARVSGTLNCARGAIAEYLRLHDANEVPRLDGRRPARRRA